MEEMTNKVVEETTEEIAKAKAKKDEVVDDSEETDEE